MFTARTGDVEEFRDAVQQGVVRDRATLSRSRVLYLHLRPFVPKKDRERRAGCSAVWNCRAICGGERVIDPIAAIAQLLDLRERIGAPFFLRDHDVNVDFRSLAIAFSIASWARGISLINSPRTTSPMAKPSAGNETAPSLSC